MIKITNNAKAVIVSLTPAEYGLLTRAKMDTVSDGTETDLQWMRELVRFADDNKAGIQDVKNRVDILAEKLRLLIEA